MNTDLLLLHGTIYGHIHADVGCYVFPGRSSRLVGAEAVPWRDSIPYIAAPGVALCGPITSDNIPIDVVSWDAGPGAVGPTGLEIWQQCLTLLMRHI